MSGFLPRGVVEKFLRFKRPDLAEIALELRDVVSTRCPEAEERILWGGLSYHDPSKGGPVKGAICQIELRPDHVRLSFIHGVRISDPDQLLSGGRRSKRYVMLERYDATPWDSVAELIARAAELDPTQFDSIE